MTSDILVQASGLSKAYRIWNTPGARLRSIALHCVKHMVPGTWAACSRAQSRLYQDFYALREVNLTIRRGESLGIVGRNGSGKSTLLQMIAGTLSPTAGTVFVGGKVAALLELGSGFNPEFTGREDVVLNASILGLTENEVAERMEAIVHQTNPPDPYKATPHVRDRLREKMKMP